jgi:hypothetical protein
MTEGPRRKTRPNGETSRRRRPGILGRLSRFFGAYEHFRAPSRLVRGRMMRRAGEAGRAGAPEIAPIERTDEAEAP